ncbi:MAG: cysteine--tRNA ligase [Dehalococcoidia bacterium]|nr:cysteine--tRNA ligase [Dehalococcoidia bacterium]
MRLYDTLSGQLHDFDSPNGQVRMYVCGITPYSSSHIGHAMSAVSFDVVRRYLEFRGFNVKHIQNFTDIDDKMIAAANERGIEVSDLAYANIQEYIDAMGELNVAPAHEYPRATQEIDKIVEIIQSLIDKGYAYDVDGDVYFRVRRDEDYGKLSHRSIDDLLSGARIEIDERKEDVLDFALWKSQKPDEPAWDSPWGPGRPGWHIECTAMSIKYLGESIDIHGGGEDLVFPHHENEIAQSESFTDVEPFARFWLHNGMLRLGVEKMSKSLGNIISLPEALDKFEPQALRLFFLSSHYRSPLFYSEEVVHSQERAIRRLRQALRVESGSGPSVISDDFRTRFVEAMDDDLNTPRALAVLFDLTREINRGRDHDADVSDAQKALSDLAAILGLDLTESEDDADTSAGPFIQLLVDLRSDLRAARQFDQADRIRDELTNLGVSLEDTPAGTEWTLR